MEHHLDLGLPHPRAGRTAPQELAFTFANALEYVRAATSAGLDPDRFGERLSFFFACHSDFLEEVAKFRARGGSGRGS